MGGIGEIGVAAGKSFGVLAFTRRANESLLACDLFTAGYEKDNCPEVNMPMFTNLLEYLHIPLDDVSILRRNSLSLIDRDLFRYGGFHGSDTGGGYKLFHVDGGHYAEAALNDINIAACALVPGGVLLVDDLHNLRWPGVQEAF